MKLHINRKRAFRLAAALLGTALLFGLSACSSDDDDNADNAAIGSVSASTDKSYTLLAYTDNEVTMSVSLSGTAFACSLPVGSDVTNVIRVSAGGDVAKNVVVAGGGISEGATSATLTVTVSPTVLSGGTFGVTVDGTALTSRRSLSCPSSGYSVDGARATGAAVTLSKGKSQTVTYTITLNGSYTFADAATGAVQVEDGAGVDKPNVSATVGTVEKSADGKTLTVPVTVTPLKSTGESGTLAFVLGDGAVTGYNTAADGNAGKTLQCVADAPYAITGATVTATGSVDVLYAGSTFSATASGERVITLTFEDAYFDTSKSVISIIDPSGAVTNIAEASRENGGKWSNTGYRTSVSFNLTGAYAMNYEGDSRSGSLSISVTNLHGVSGDTVAELTASNTVPYALTYAPGDRLAVPSARLVQLATGGDVSSKNVVALVSLDTVTANAHSLAVALPAGYPLAAKAGTTSVGAATLEAVSAGATEIPVVVDATGASSGANVSITIPASLMSDGKALTVGGDTVARLKYAEDFEDISGTQVSTLTIKAAAADGTGGVYAYQLDGTRNGKAVPLGTTSISERYTPELAKEIDLFLGRKNAFLTVADGERNNNGCVVTLGSYGLYGGTTKFEGSTSGIISAGSSFVIGFRLRIANSNNQTPVIFNVYDAGESNGVTSGTAAIFSLTAQGAGTETWLVNGDASRPLTLTGTATGSAIGNCSWYTVLVERTGSLTYVTITDKYGLPVLARTKVPTLSATGGLGRLEFETRRYYSNFGIDDIVVYGMKL